jgi:phage-related protein
MISSTTAVPKINSDPLMDKINEIEKTKKIVEENISNLTLDLTTRRSINLLIITIKDIINGITFNLTPGGLIDFLIKIIEWLISVVQNLINLVYEIIDLVEIISTLVDLIGTLFELIIELINKIIDIFTPGSLKS